MKRSWIAGLAVGLAVSGVSVGWADENQNPLFQKLDTNQDGKLTAAEVSEEHRGIFERLVGRHDQDGDGALSTSEFREGIQSTAAPRSLEKQQPAGQGAERMKMMLKRLDKNGDQAITKDEVPEAMKTFFVRILEQVDANSDGRLERSEVEKQQEQIARLAQRYRQDGATSPKPEMIFERLDRDKSGAVEDNEVPEEHRERFSRLRERADKDADGSVSRQEFLDGFGQLAKAPEAKAPEEGPQRGKRPEGAGDRPRREGRGPDGGERGERRGERGEGRGRGPGGEGGFIEGMMRRLKELDTNDDGKISREEADKAERLKPQFDKIDANSDGMLDKEEVKKHLEAMAKRFGGGPGGPGAGGPGGQGDFAKNMIERLKKLDTNNDEKLSRDEVKEAGPLKEHFKEIDTNGDDVLDKAEMKSHLEKMMQRFGGQRGGPGGRPEAGRRGEGRPEGRGPGKPGEDRKPRE